MSDRISDSPVDDRARVSEIPVPKFDTTAFVTPPALATARVALVTTAGLHHPEDPGWQAGEQSFRVLGGSRRDLRLGQLSSNFDRAGIMADLNVIFPVDRLDELAAEGVIGSVSPQRLSFMGAIPDANLSTIRLDSGPAAAAVLKQLQVGIVLMTPA